MVKKEENNSSETDFAFCFLSLFYLLLKLRKKNLDDGL